MNTTVHPESTTTRLLDSWKQKKGLDTDYKAAKAMGVTTPTISNWRKGKSHARPSLAAKMARDLNMDELQILAAIEADRAYDGEDRRVWQKHGRAAFMALLVGIQMGVPSEGWARVPSQQGSLPHPVTPEVRPLCEIPYGPSWAGGQGSCVGS